MLPTVVPIFETGNPFLIFETGFTDGFEALQRDFGFK